MVASVFISSRPNQALKTIPLFSNWNLLKIASYINDCYLLKIAPCIDGCYLLKVALCIDICSLLRIAMCIDDCYLQKIALCIDISYLLRIALCIAPTTNNSLKCHDGNSLRTVAVPFHQLHLLYRTHYHWTLSHHRMSTFLRRDSRLISSWKHTLHSTWLYMLLLLLLMIVICRR